jgi:hypothetical protein
MLTHDKSYGNRSSFSSNSVNKEKFLRLKLLEKLEDRERERPSSMGKRDEALGFGGNL